MLQAKLKEAAAELENPDMESILRIQVNPPSSPNAEFQAQIAREIASLKVGMESKTSTKNLSDFGFSMIAVPEFREMLRSTLSGMDKSKIT